jgi:hypothetical protein
MNATETPVAYTFSSHITRYGIITETDGKTAKVQWQAQAHKGSKGYTERMKLTTKLKVCSLKPWAERLRLNDGMTLNPDGLEYRTPKA